MAARKKNSFSLSIYLKRQFIYLPNNRGKIANKIIFETLFKYFQKRCNVLYCKIVRENYENFINCNMCKKSGNSNALIKLMRILPRFGFHQSRLTVLGTFINFACHNCVIIKQSSQSREGEFIHDRVYSGDEII